MNFQSTRNSSKQVTSAQAIVQGISEDGGLFVPQTFPRLSIEDIASLGEKSYCQRAAFILSKYLTDFTSEQICQCVNQAYGGGKFSSQEVAPLHCVDTGMYSLELWHGPTCAFKDMALQLLPHLMVTASSIVKNQKEIVILVATSGDTGKAALEGFKDVPGTRILVFYPEDGVSPMQKLQMTTQEGNNVGVCAIYGNFDDAQTGVKHIFGNKQVAQKLAEHNMVFSSANSINWGRLVPQIVYYFSAYADLVKKGAIKNGEKINFVVPTGNFGNILAGYYAKQMGLPVHKFICASNSNKVLTDFIQSGVYSKNRPFYQTISPSMDILVSSNLERLLYLMEDRNDEKVKSYFEKLAKYGEYTVSEEVKQQLQQDFYGGFATDEQTMASIRNLFDKTRYLCDSHTAVAVCVYEEYKKQSGDTTPTVIVSTASAYKFSASVLQALAPNVDYSSLSEFEMVEQLHKSSGTEIPVPIAGLKDRRVLHREKCDRADMANMVYSMLGI